MMPSITLPRPGDDARPVAWLLTHDDHGGGRIFSVVEALRALGFLVRAFHRIRYPHSMADPTPVMTQDFHARTAYHVTAQPYALVEFASTRRMLDPLIARCASAPPDGVVRHFDLDGGWTAEAAVWDGGHAILLEHPDHNPEISRVFCHLSSGGWLFHSNMPPGAATRAVLLANIQRFAEDLGTAVVPPLDAIWGVAAVPAASTADGGPWYDPETRFGGLGGGASAFALVPVQPIDLAPFNMRVARGLWPGYERRHSACLSAQHFAAVSRERPALIFVADAPLLPLGLAFKERLGSPLVYDAHEWWMWQERTWWPDARDRIAAFDDLERELYPRADARITVGEELAEAMEAHLSVPFAPVYICAELRAVETSPNASSPDFWTDRYGVPAGTRVSVFLGNLTPLRNLETLMAATRWLADGQALVVIGDGRQRAVMERVLNTEGRAERVLFLGDMAYDDIAHHLAHGDLAVLPYIALNPYYRTWMTAKFADYFQARLPILLDASMRGCARLVERYGIGAVTDCSRAESLGMSLRRLLAAPEELACMRAGYEATGDLFTFRGLVSDLRRVVEPLCSVPNPAEKA
ncbi:glycosyltransferase [Azospirillum tabaci]|uniref:glycosyltransferase n=1 Tax=Azospirillum tabaci TaxID=2752310 RepID=UPI0016611541|nr:glycosyltransferase [Azospirillum tabaci]